MACIHCVLVQGYLLYTLIVPALLGRHLAIGLGLASRGGRGGGRGGVVLRKCSGWFLCGMRTWETPNTSKQILILVQEIYCC